MKRILSAIAFAIVLLLPQARGQVLWQEVGGGTDNAITDMVADSASGLVYMCGWFEYAGSLKVENSAAWDGQNWVLQGAGAGYADSCGVNSCVDFSWITVNGLNVFVGGQTAFLDSGNTWRPSYLTRWDGQHWDTCGLPSPTLSPHTCNKQTFLFGFNTGYVNGQLIPNVAIWNGASWDNFTNYLDLEGGYIKVMEYYKGMYHFGGNFRHQPGIKEVAAYDGTQWLPLGNGILGDTWVTGLKEYQGLLYVGGEFNWALGNAGDYIMAWDGAQWLHAFDDVQFTSQVRHLEVIDGKLFMAGWHYVKRNGIWEGPFGLAKYDGTEFCSFGGPAFPVFAMAGLNGHFYVSNAPAYLPGNARFIAEYIGTSADEVCIPVSAPNAVRPAQRDFAQVYPNPARDHATLTTLATTQGEVAVQLFSATGVLARETRQAVTETGSVEVELDLRGLAPGAYIAVATTPDGVVRSKVVVQ